MTGHLTRIGTQFTSYASSASPEQVQDHAVPGMHEREMAGHRLSLARCRCSCIFRRMSGLPSAPRLKWRMKWRNKRKTALGTALMLAVAVVSLASCSSDRTPASAATTTQRGGPPDELPRMLNAELPFRYPPALYAQKIQANVLLRLYVDSLGAVVRDSTMVVESSGAEQQLDSAVAEQLDSAAVTGATDLVFAPARRAGSAVGTMVLLPVHFRHPDEPPMPGDSVVLPQAAAKGGR